MRTILALSTIVLLVACGPGTDAPDNGISNETAEAACLPLDAADKAALRQLDQDYAAAWLLEGTEAQREALLDLFEEDATIIPGGGAEPISGRDAYDAFWFPPDTTPTIVSRFQRATSSVDGNSCFAAITGRSNAAWVFDGEETVYEGNYMILARPRPTGEWRITKMTWNSRPQPE